MYHVYIMKFSSSYLWNTVAGIIFYNHRGTVSTSRSLNKLQQSLQLRGTIQTYSTITTTHIATGSIHISDKSSRWILIRVQIRVQIRIRQ